MTTPQDQIDQFVADTDLAHQIVHGDANTTVTTAGGPVRSMAKFIADNQAAINAAMPNFNLIANGTATDAGALTGAEIDSLTRGTGLLQTTLGNRAAFSIRTYQGYSQGGTGAQNRTVLDKLTEVISLDDFDTLANAVAKASTTGRPVRLPGRALAITLTADLVIPGGVRLRGVRGQTKIVITGAFSIRAGGNRIGLKDIGVSGGVYGFSTNGFNKHTIETCDFDSQTNHCAYCDTNNNEITRCTFTNGLASAVAVVGSTAYNNEITRNTVTNCANFGIWLSSGANRNLIEGNKTLQNGLELVGATYNCWENRIHHNHAEGTGDNGISVTGYRNSVMGNNCSNNANHGIGLYGERNQCIGNTGRNNGQRNVATPGAGTYAGVTATPAFGGLGRKNVIQGNRFDDDQGTPTQYAPIKVEVNSHMAWASGQAVSNANLYRYNGLNIYVANGPGTTGASAPTHTSGSVSDGGVTWTWICSNVNSLSRIYVLWSSGQVIAVADLFRYYGNNLYVASAAGTTGATPPTHVSGAVSDGAVTWTFIEEFPSNLDSYDNEVMGNRGSGTMQSSVVVNNTSNKHTIIMPGLFRIPTAGRNQYADVLNGNGSPAGVVTARPGSIYARQDVSAPGIAFWIKQSGTDSSGWLRATCQDSGTTAQRPSLSSYGTGARNYCYFDTSLGTNGKPIWWSGSLWVDATGTSV